MAYDASNMTVNAWRRENGRVGVRNHVIILPVDDISNAACEAVANNVKGTMALPHSYGRLQFGEDLDLHFRTMIGTGSNPNVAACVVIGIEPIWTQKVVDGIASTGKPVAGFAIEKNGDISTIASAILKVHSATNGVATGRPTASASSGIATSASPIPKVERSRVPRNSTKTMRISNDTMIETVTG